MNGIRGFVDDIAGMEVREQISMGTGLRIIYSAADHLGVPRELVKDWLVESCGRYEEERNADH